MSTETKSSIKILKHLLLAAARWSTDDDKITRNIQNIEYVSKRVELLENRELKDYIPDYILANIDLKSHHSAIKAEYSGKGSYAMRSEAINKDFKAIENHLEGIKTSVPPGMTLSQEQIKKNINETFKTKGSVLENIYGIFTLSRKSLGDGGTSTVKGFMLGNKEYAVKFLTENVASSESTQFKRFKQAHLNISELQSSGKILPQLHIDTLEISRDLVVPYTIMPVAKDTLKGNVQRKKKEGSFTINHFEKIFNELSDAIKVMHEHNIIHRDLKPENLFIHNKHLVIGDFDIAKFNDPDHAILVVTEKGDRLANFGFSAPEQSTKNFNEITSAADWFAFGQILHWSITGDVKKGSTAVNYSSFGVEYMRFEPLIDCLLRDKPSERPQNIEEVKKLLTKVITKEESIYNFDRFLDKYTVGNAYGNRLIAIDKKDEIVDFIETLSKDGGDFQLCWCQGQSDSKVKSFQQSEESSTLLRIQHATTHLQEVAIKKIVIYQSPYGSGGNIFVIESAELEPIINENLHGENYEYYKEYHGKKYKESDIRDGWGLIDGKREALDGSENGVERTLNETVMFFATQHGFTFLKNFECLSAIHSTFNKDFAPELNYRSFEALRRPQWVR